MNTGALKIHDRFEHLDILQQVCAKIMDRKWQPTNPDFPELETGWTMLHFYEYGRESDYAKEFPEMVTVRKWFKCPVEQLMFIAVQPGIKVRPHRDMSGNLPFGRLRFHIPIITNPKIVLIVGGQRLSMGLGELWALDTSYKHSIENPTDQVRVHCLVQVVANEWVWSLLPKRSIRYYAHVLSFWAVACVVGLRKLFTNPGYIAFALRDLFARFRA